MFQIICSTHVSFEKSLVSTAQLSLFPTLQKISFTKESFP